MNVKYKNFVFPSNPQKIKCDGSSNSHISPIPHKSSAVENVSSNPVKISGSGSFAAALARESCSILMHLLRSKKSGWLFVPGIAPIRAFFTEFIYEVNSKSGICEYSFEFIEDCSNTLERAELSYVTANEGENAFDIAFDNSVSVDDIMALNNLKTPFDINEGDRVALK